MEERFSRTALLLGQEGIEALRRARVAVFGLGGVGSYAAEALARSGVGTLDLIDHDTVSPSNLNRQLFALQSTIGQYKTAAAKARLSDSSPDTAVNAYPVFYGPETAGQFDFARYDYIIDAIDTVTGKLALVQQARQAGTPIISSMGTGNKLHPEALEIGDISQTSVCPLARIMRRELRRRGIEHLRVIYSKEPPLSAAGGERKANGRPVPGSTAFVPAAAGLLAAGEVVRALTGRP